MLCNVRGDSIPSNIKTSVLAFHWSSTKCCPSRKTVAPPPPYTFTPSHVRSYSTWLFLPGFGQVGDAGVRTHEHVARVQRPLQEELLGLRQVDATQGSLGQSVGGHQSQAVHPHLMDTVYRLESQYVSEKHFKDD